MKLAFAILSLLLPALSQAQTYTIDWYKVSGGAGSSTGGTFSVDGTIGQHDSSQVLSGGKYSVTGGFWSLLAVVQTPGAPTLYVSRSSNTVSVFWSNVSGWNLQQNASLANGNGWSLSTGVTTLNGTNYLNVLSPVGALFFRVVHP